MHCCAIWGNTTCLLMWYLASLNLCSFSPNVPKYPLLVAIPSLPLKSRDLRRNLDTCALHCISLLFECHLSVRWPAGCELLRARQGQSEMECRGTTGEMAWCFVWRMASCWPQASYWPRGTPCSLVRWAAGHSGRHSVDQGVCLHWHVSIFRVI